MTIKTYLAVLFVAWGLTQSATAEQPRVSSEVDKAARVRDILKDHPLTLKPGYGNKSEAFCNAFYAAMRSADKSIVYVEPVVSTDDPDHPGLERYRSCPNYPGVGETVYPGDIRVIGDRAFRLYRLDVDRKRKHGFEEHIYAEVDRSVPLSVAQFSGYQQVNFENCEIQRNLGISPRHAGWFADSLNAIIRYHRRYYVFELGGYPNRHERQMPVDYVLSLYAYVPSKTANNFPLACDWKWQATPMKGE